MGEAHVPVPFSNRGLNNQRRGTLPGGGYRSGEARVARLDGMVQTCLQRVRSISHSHRALRELGGVPYLGVGENVYRSGENGGSHHRLNGPDLSFPG